MIHKRTVWWPGLLYPRATPSKRTRQGSLRHAFVTLALDAGVPLQDVQDVQDAMGHADPRTTRAYDRSRHRLDSHATYAMAAWLRRSTED